MGLGSNITARLQAIEVNVIAFTATLLCLRKIFVAARFLANANPLLCFPLAGAQLTFQAKAILLTSKCFLLMP